MAEQDPIVSFVRRLAASSPKFTWILVRFSTFFFYFGHSLLELEYLLSRRTISVLWQSVSGRRRCLRLRVRGQCGRIIHRLYSQPLVVGVPTVGIAFLRNYCASLLATKRAYSTCTPIMLFVNIAFEWDLHHAASGGTLPVRGLLQGFWDYCRAVWYKRALNGSIAMLTEALAHP